MKNPTGCEPSECISTCIPTYEKGIYYNTKIESKSEVGRLNKPFNHMTSFEYAGSAREIGLENTLSTEEFQQEYSRMHNNFPLKNLLADQYLSQAEPYISKLISPDNFKEVLSVAHHFPGNLTSFLGFECRLGDNNSRVDWAFAVSGIGKDRHVLANLMEHKYLPESFLEQSEWQRISKFASAWADSNSVLKDKVQCFWLEFDMPKKLPEIPVPCIFFGPSKLPKGKSSNDISQYNWLVDTALPILRGASLSKQLEQRLMNCIKKMPENASLFQVGTLLSRSTNGIRIYVNRLKSNQIMPYLKSLGWKDEKGELTKLISDLENIVERFVICVDVNTKGIGSTIGIECSFKSTNFQHETRWKDLLDYLVTKRLCLPEKRDALLSYPGIENIGDYSGAIMKPLASASKSLDDIYSSTFVRYINHVKIVYQPGRPTEAKAYPAVRLFE